MHRKIEDNNIVSFAKEGDGEINFDYGLFPRELWVHIASYCEYYSLKLLAKVGTSWRSMLEPLIMKEKVRLQFATPHYDPASVHNFPFCLGDNKYVTYKFDPADDTLRLLVANTRREVIKDYGDPSVECNVFDGLSTLCYYAPSTMLCVCNKRLAHFSLESGKVEKEVTLERPAMGLINSDVRFQTGVDGDNMLCLWWFSEFAHFHDVHSGLITGMPRQFHLRLTCEES
jgi:hypothetical protein